MCVCVYLDSRNRFFRHAGPAVGCCHHISLNASELFLVVCDDFCFLLEVRTKAREALHTHTHKEILLLFTNGSVYGDIQKEVIENKSK